MKQSHSIQNSRSFAALGAVIFFFTITSAFAATTTTWSGAGASANWSDNNNWFGNITPPYGNLAFTNNGGTQGTTMSDNSITAQNQLLWSGSSSWTLNQGGSTVLSLFDNSGVQAKIENDSTSLVTINLPITLAANNGTPPNPFGEINAVNANLTFGTGTLTVNGTSVNGVKLFGGSRVVNFNNTVSASGKWFGITTGGTGNTININGAFTCSDFYDMNDGTVNLNSGGTLTGNVRLGGDFGNTGNQVTTKSGTFNLTAAAGGQTYSSVINSVSGNTSGTLSVNSQNTSGTNTLAGHIALDVALKITQSAGGNLAITQARATTTDTASGTDIKGNTLTITPASTASIVHSGTIYSSTSNNAATISLNGAGSLTLSGSTDNAFAQANVSAGTLVLNKTSSSTVHALGGATNTVSGGTLQLSGSGGDQIQDGALLAVNSGTFDLNGNSETVVMLDGSGGVVTNSSASTDSTLTLNVGASVADNYTGKVATATSGGKINLVLNHATGGTASLYSLNNSSNTFKGSIKVIGVGSTAGTNGVLGINGDGCLGDVGNTLTLTNGGGLANMYSPTTAGTFPNHTAFTLNAGRTIALAGTAGGVIRLGFADTCTINSTITGSGPLAKTDNGNLILGGANTYSGDTTIASGGSLTLGNSLAVQNSTINYLASGGTLSLGTQTAITLGGLEGGQSLGLTNASGAAVALTVGNNNVNTTNYTGVLSGSGGLTKVGNGALTLAGGCTFTGNTTIGAGTLALTGAASIANTTNISLASGSTFDVSGLSSAFGLGGGQILIARGATGTVKGSFNMNSGALVVTNAPGTATLTVTSGTLTLSSSGSVTVSIANGGTPLGIGSYKLISKGAGGTVAGTVPSSVTIQGDGIATGAAAGLQISGGELFLAVTCNGTLSVGISSQSNVSCNGGNNGSVTVSGSGGSGSGYTYSINGGGFGAGASFSGLSAGSNFVSVMDSLGCTASSPVIITQPSALSLGLTPVNPSSCGGSNGTVQAAFSGGTGPYQVKIDAGSYSTQTSPFTFTGLSAGLHTVSLQDANGCTTNLGSTLSDPSGSTLGISATPDTCNGGSDGSVTATFSGSGPFQLAIDGGSFNTQASPFTFTGLLAGSHTVILKDNNGCTSTLSTNVTQPDAVTFSTVGTNLTCNGSANGSIAITAAGGNSNYVYSIDSGVTYQTNSLFSGLSAATYQVAVRDTNNCQSVTNAVTLTQPAALSCSITPPSTEVCSGSTQNFTVNPTGGTTNYTYAWTGPGGFSASTQSINPGVAGTYTNTVTDANGCTTTCTATLAVDATPVGGTATPALSNVCTNTGTSITLSGNVGTIQWQSRTGANAFADISGETNVTLNTGNLSATTDFRAVISSGVCSSAFSTTNTIVVNPASVGGTATAGASSLCGGGITTIVLTNFTGSIQWLSSTDNVTFSNVTGGSGATNATYTTPSLTATTYYEAVVTSGACSSSTSSVATVSVTIAPGISGQPLSLTNCGGSSSTLSVTANGTSPSFNWRKRGTGWGSGWTFNTGAGGFFLADSSNNGGGGTGNINTGGKSWGMFSTNGTFVTEAIRTFPSAVQVGQQFQIDVDIGFISDNNGVGLSLRNASGNVVWEFYFIGGAGNGWKINDNSGATVLSGSGLGFTADGVRLVLTLTGPTNYSATVLTKPLLGGGTLFGPFTGALKNPAGGSALAQIRLWDNNGAGGTDHDAFFNSILVNGTADDNAGNYTTWTAGSDKGDQPLTNSATISGATTSTLTINPDSTNDTGSYDVVVQNSCGITNSAAATLTVNGVPTANTATYQRGNFISLKISVTNLLSNASSAGGGTPALVSVSGSTNGANLSITNGFVLYTNSVTPNVNDSFTYTVMDTNTSCESVGTVLITVVGGQIGQTNATVSVTSTNATVSFFGVPGFSYITERSTNLSVGEGWVSISTNTAPTNGLFQITDDFHDLGIIVPPIPSPAFYRLMTP